MTWFTQMFNDNPWETVALVAVFLGGWAAVIWASTR